MESVLKKNGNMGQSDILPNYILINSMKIHLCSNLGSWDIWEECLHKEGWCSQKQDHKSKIRFESKGRI